MTSESEEALVGLGEGACLTVGVGFGVGFGVGLEEGL